MKYIAKPNTWFDEGTEAFPVTEFWDGFDDWEMKYPLRAAIFRGIRNGKWDEESCGEYEFEIVEENVRFIDAFEIKE